MRFEWFQSQILAKILNILHIKFQNHILKTQLSINWGKMIIIKHPLEDIEEIEKNKKTQERLG